MKIFVELRARFGKVCWFRDGGPNPCTLAKTLRHSRNTDGPFSREKVFSSVLDVGRGEADFLSVDIPAYTGHYRLFVPGFSFSKVDCQVRLSNIRSQERLVESAVKKHIEFSAESSNRAGNFRHFEFNNHAADFKT